MRKNSFENSLDKYTDFVSLQHLGEEFGIDSSQLMDRLEKGCSYPVALLAPADWDIQKVKEYPRRDRHYEIYQCVFRGTEKDLIKLLKK